MSVIPEEDFKAQKACYLNPTFGLASRLVGGGDADVVIDDKIIDIKTTKNFKLDSTHIHQLVGYYVLLYLGGIDFRQNSNLHYFSDVSEIHNLCIYFSRYGYLHTIKMNDLINLKSISDFVKWFIKSACSTQKELTDYCNNFRGQAAKEVLHELNNQLDY